MITPAEFPYLQQLHINDCYAHQNLTIPVFEAGQPFKHLILTGRNGSGKTTVLRAVAEVIRYDTNNKESAAVHVGWLQSIFKRGDQPKRDTTSYQRQLDTIGKVLLTYSEVPQRLMQAQSELIIAFFEATRKTQLQDVETVSRDADLVLQINKDHNPVSPSILFKQYLVNKKVFQIFEVMEGNQEAAQQEAQFFTRLEETLAKIFADKDLKLEFVRENFEFYINLSDGRRFTFNQLSAGFSAFLSILTELLMRTDLLRKQANDYRYDPCGFVLIDEPETHLHLEMQYQMLPLLTGLFPNLQFIVATHSPAVASSITGATVFDLSTGQQLGDVAAGSSYSELMQGHFGVENEFSNVADDIMADIARIAKLPDHTQARRELLDLLAEKGRYMSPVLRLEVEAQLIGLQEG